MDRRAFITLLGGAAAAWPMAARAQQPALPTIGLMIPGSADAVAEPLAGFRKGLADLGYVEGRNLAIEFRWYEPYRFTDTAAELARRPLQAIFVTGPAPTRAVLAETKTIPVVFAMGEDPVSEGVVTSLNRPSGNVTGFTTLTNQLFAKRLQLLHEVVPKNAVLAMLVSGGNRNAGPDSKEAQAASAALGHELRVLSASGERDFEPAFARIAEQRAAGLLVGVDPFFLTKRALLGALATRHAVPTMFDRREYPMAGGLMSYGASSADTWRQAGVYVGRILRGAKPADLPVQQAAKLELVLNLNTAKALSLEIPSGVLAIADEVFE
jgi:putative ABC transport system substrate-binding protein